MDFEHSENIGAFTVTLGKRAGSRLGGVSRDNEYT